MVFIVFVSNVVGTLVGLFSAYSFLETYSFVPSLFGGLLLGCFSTFCCFMVMFKIGEHLKKRQNHA